MASIADKIAQIRQAILGKDVREALASGMEAINAETENTTQRQDYIETLVDEAEQIRQAAEEVRIENENERIDNENLRQSQETARQESIADIETRFDTLTTEQQQEAEVIDARKGEISLRAKIDAMDNEVASHLSDYENTIEDNLKHYNLATYMRGGKTAIGAMTDILTEIGTSGARSKIYAPAGYYDFENIVSSFALPSSLTIKGDGINSTIFKVKNKELFSIGSENGMITNIIFKDLQFSCASIPNVNQVCFGVRNGGDIISDNVQYSNVATIMIGGTSALGCYNVRFINLKGYLYNLGTPAFKIYNGNGLFIDGSFAVNGTNTPIHGELMNTVEGTDFIQTFGNWDTIMVSGIYERFYRVLFGDSNGKVFQNVTLEGIFDFTRKSCISLSTSNGLGGIFNIKIVNSWVSCWEGIALDIRNSSYVTINNCDIPVSGSHGIHIYDVKNATISDNRISGIGQADDSMNGILVSASCVDIIIHGNNLNYFPEGGMAWGATPWIYVDSSADKYNIVGNLAFGYVLPTPTTPNSNRIVSNNTQWGNEPSTRYDKVYTITFPANDVAFVNPYAFELEIYITGTINSIYKNSAQIVGSMTSGCVTVRLRPNESITISKTTATWKVFGVA